jgi:uncharacterized protein (DUF885 family)
MSKGCAAIVVVCTCLLLAVGCGRTESTAGPTATMVPLTATVVPPTQKAVLLASPAPTHTGEPTDTPEPTPSPPPTATLTAVPTATAPPTRVPHTPTPESAVAAIVGELRGLRLEDFFEESYQRLLLRNPEYLTALGAAGSFGLRNDQLNDLSDAYIRETQELESAMLDLLRTYDRTALTPELRVSYDVYEWYLDDRVRGHEFAHNDYPLHHFLGSYHDELIRLFTEIHPLTSRADAQDYVSRLSQVDGQVGQLLEGLKRREEMGIIPPDFIVRLTLHEITGYLQTSSRDAASINAEALSVYTVFRDKLDNIEALTADEKEGLLDAARIEITESFIPAYVQLLAYLDHLQTIATSDAGVWKFPNGDAYYAYLLRSQTSTDLTPTEIHELGLTEVERIHGELQQAFADLGYRSDLGLGELFNRAERDAGYYEIGSELEKEKLIEAYDALIAEVDRRVDAAFDIRPEAKVAVVGGPMGGYYVPGSSDGSRPGAFHVSTSGTWASKMYMAPVAYHEAVPGHHLQIALAQELDLPTFRTDVFFNGYGEGWALYAEQLAWELGLYEDDPYGNIGRLWLELLRAVRLVADTGIHALGWTRAQANAYMAEAFGAPPGTSFYEVDRYIVEPAQATGYKVGMIKILELRQRAIEQLGEEFDLKDFHNVVLGNGSVPLDILERLVDEYIDAKLATSAHSSSN